MESQFFGERRVLIRLSCFPSVEIGVSPNKTRYVFLQEVNLAEVELALPRTVSQLVKNYSLGVDCRPRSRPRKFENGSIGEGGVPVRPMCFVSALLDQLKRPFQIPRPMVNAGCENAIWIPQYQRQRYLDHISEMPIL